ncbi:MAG: hypothetical protein IPK76_04880 [Lewinellaceae bacterium]|nr:hypothetical protein [Lewinellaceae bacterium]
MLTIGHNSANYGLTGKDGAIPLKPIEILLLMKCPGSTSLPVNIWKKICGLNIRSLNMEVAARLCFFVKMSLK